MLNITLNIKFRDTKFQSYFLSVYRDYKRMVLFFLQEEYVQVLSPGKPIYCISALLWASESINPAKHELVYPTSVPCIQIHLYVYIYLYSLLAIVLHTSTHFFDATI